MPSLIDWCSPANDDDLHPELGSPVFPQAIGSVGRAGDAAGECQTHPVSKAQSGAMAVERRGEAGIEAVERTHRYTEGAICESIFSAAMPTRSAFCRTSA